MPFDSLEIEENAFLPCSYRWIETKYRWFDYNIVVDIRVVHEVRTLMLLRRYKRSSLGQHVVYG
jgi:hypothetical protein